MKLHVLRAEQTLPIRIDQAWEFFSNPINLERITPADLHLVVQGERPHAMHPGQILTYRVRPFPLYSASWVTEITHVDAPRFFVDEQRIGPYSFWHHQHRFEAVEHGVRVSDEVHYALPWWPLGELAHGVLVRPTLERIFEHRRRTLEQLFPKP